MLNLAELINSAPLGDPRRNARALTLTKAMLQGQMSGTHGVPGAGGAMPWADTVAAFRFFNNDKLSIPALFEPCRQGLAQLLAPQARALVIHDVSVVDYSTHQAKHDLVPVGDGRGLGYELFTALVLDSKGTPLGSVFQELRTATGCLSSVESELVPFTNHYTQVERAIAAARTQLPGHCLIHIMDAEFDELQLLRSTAACTERYLVRAQHLRRQVLFQGTPMPLAQVVAHLPLAAAGTLERQGVRWALFQGETFVQFHGPSHRGVARHHQAPRSGPALPVRVVVTELRRPGHKSLQWVLLTNLTDPLSTVVQYYAWRWRIERLFYLVKVGFRLEHWHQESAPALMRRLALTMLAAQLIYQLLARAQDPRVAPLLRKVATLGGWLGRKRDRMGPIVLMRGMLLLLGMLSAWETYGPAELQRLVREFATTFGLV
jgi:hypothetical protein